MGMGMEVYELGRILGCILVSTGLYWGASWSLIIHVCCIVVCIGLYWSLVLCKNLCWPIVVFTGLYWFIMVRVSELGAHTGPCAGAHGALSWYILVGASLYWFMLVYTSPNWFILVQTGLHWLPLG